MTRNIPAEEDKTSGGQYRWRCERCDKVVFYRPKAQPENEKYTCLDCYERKRPRGRGYDYYEGKWSDRYDY